LFQHRFVLAVFQVINDIIIISSLFTHVCSVLNSKIRASIGELRELYKTQHTLLMFGY